MPRKNASAPHSNLFYFRISEMLCPRRYDLCKRLRRMNATFQNISDHFRTFQNISEETASVRRPESGARAKDIKPKKKREQVKNGTEKFYLSRRSIYAEWKKIF